MSQVEKLLAELKEKYGIDPEAFLELYKEGMSTEAMAEALSCTEWSIRVLASTMNLRLPKKHRLSDIALFLSRFSESAEVKIAVELVEADENLELLSKQVVQKEKTIKVLQAEISKYKRGLKQEVGKDSIELLIQETIGSIKPLEATTSATHRETTSYSERTQFILLSDMHCEETVSFKDLGVGNSYSWEIMEQRLGKVFSETLNAYRGESKIILISCGDQISGILHDTMESTNKYTGEAIADLAKLFAKYTMSLAEIYDEVEVLATTGNHSRLSEQRKAAGNGFNLEYLMYEIWKALVPNSNVKFSFGHSGYITTMVSDKVFGVHHGDYHRGGYGTTKTLKIQEAFRQATGLSPYHIAQGHLHIPLVEIMHTGGQYLTNGSMIGPNSYSHSSGFTGVPWVQTIGCFLEDGNIEYTKWVSG